MCHFKLLIMCIDTYRQMFAHSKLKNANNLSLLVATVSCCDPKYGCYGCSAVVRELFLFVTSTQPLSKQINRFTCTLKGSLRLSLFFTSCICGCPDTLNCFVSRAAMPVTAFCIIRKRETAW